MKQRSPPGLLLVYASYCSFTVHMLIKKSINQMVNSLQMCCVSVLGSFSRCPSSMNMSSARNSFIYTTFCFFLVSNEIWAPC